MIYIVANSKATSGGPELSQQLCYVLNKNGISSQMVYFSRYRFPETKLGESMVERYKEYNNPIASKVEDKEENMIIFPETTLFLLDKFKNMKKVIWWMSVDNYYVSLSSPFYKRYDLFNQIKKSNIFGMNYYHVCQSRYAYLFLQDKGVKEQKMCMLSDFTNAKFISETKDENMQTKENSICYNPKKGIEYTEKIMRKMTNVNWVPLQNMTHNEMIDVLKRTKVYIDFGNHPGKDRIPREAAMCGCCVITNKKGSAGNDLDIPIPVCYKFDTDTCSIDKIVERINVCLNDYDNSRSDFDYYRDVIRNEEVKFETEALDMVKNFN